jgi:hypothetical protein
MTAKLMTALDYRQRAQECREAAAKGGESAADYLQAAATWEALAEQAERWAAFPPITLRQSR